VRNRARWSSLAGSRRLRGLLLDVCVPEGPVLMGIDETKGIYRDPGRSSHAPFVKARGVRGVCRMVLARTPWGDRVWALPFLPVLAPSARY
jgi:hypothetical protein